MTKRRARVCMMTIAALLVMLLAVAALPWIPVAAATDPPAAELEVTGYKIETKQKDGSYKEYSGKIKKDFKFRLTLNVNDLRVGAAESVKPKARINTSSFTGSVTEPGTVVGPKYDLIFDLKYGGTGNTFQCDIYYDGSTVPLFPYTLTLNQCVEYVAPPPEPETPSEPESESSSSEPVVIGTGFALKSVNFGGSEVNAGASFNLDLEMIATSGSYNLNNVAVAVTPSKEFTIAAGASNLYVGTVKPNQTVPITVPLTASAIVEEGSYTVEMGVSGVGAKDGTPVATTITVTIPVVQPERFELSNIQVPTFLTAGMDDGSGFTSITLVNKGKGAIYNVSVKVLGDGLTSSEGEQFIGNINGGTENGADFTLMADMPGNIDGQILVTYENAKGDEKTLTHDFTVEVQDMGMGEGDWGDGGMMPEPMPEEPQGLPFWFWLIMAVAGLTAVVIVIIVVKKRRAKKAAALNDDFDEDD